MLKFNPTTAIAIWAENQEYIPGIGASSAWEQVQSGTVSAYFCEWRGTYGDRLLTAQSMGVSDLVTIRMTYNPDVFSALTTRRCVIIKNANPAVMIGGEPNKHATNIYELYSGVDDVAQEHQFMEFQARRYQGK